MTQWLNDSRSQNDSFAHNFGSSWPIGAKQSVLELAQHTYTNKDVSESQWLSDSMTQRVKMTHLLITPDPVDQFARNKVFWSQGKLGKWLNDSKSQYDSFTHNSGSGWPICMKLIVLESGQRTASNKRCFRVNYSVTQWLKESKWLIYS